jgi:hypothetical protein
MGTGAEIITNLSLLGMVALGLLWTAAVFRLAESAAARGKAIRP